ncbi:MAG: crotonobetainyl-CoA:carnitine CoA-transferase CaiB-like acyl-CoA transferase [Limisphaerales bacterium]|jgi:crotonobetainyl-CoA:carnitine CoA-transferase CaiB-like acyl-CoA transferase
MQGVFSGIKVIDAGSFLAGPCAATIMADYGADVVKIEPLTGDRHRSIAAGHPADWSWQLTDRSKRGLAMDITTDEGYQTLVEMLKQADVFLVNFSSEQMQRYNLEWDTLHAINPKLIYAQISAYGLKGPDADRRAFDLTGWFARSGILDMSHDKGVSASLPAGGVGDHATAMTLYAGITTALYKRDRTGEGSMVSTSLAATGTWANGLNLQGTMAGVDGAARRDQEGWSNPIQNVYTSKDGRDLIIAVQNIRRDYPKLLAVLEKSAWLEEENMQPVKPLFKNRFEAKERIAQAFAEFDAEVLCERLDEAGIVFSLVYKNSEVLHDEQLHANGVFIDFDSGKPGCEQTLATPFQLSSEAQQTPRPAPELGQHSAEILQQYGFNAGQIDTLRDLGVISS